MSADLMGVARGDLIARNEWAQKILNEYHPSRIDAVSVWLYELAEDTARGSGMIAHNILDVYFAKGYPEVVKAVSHRIWLDKQKIDPKNVARAAARYSSY